MTSTLFHQPAGRPLTIVHALFSPRMAGSERYCVDLAAHQSAQGHRVHVVGAPGAAMCAVLPSSVTFHALPLPLARGWRLGRLLARLGADVCHSHLSPACKAAARASGHGARTVATLHVGYKPHQHGRLQGLICVNHSQPADAGGYGGQVRVIPNWLPRMDAGLKKTCLRRELGLAHGDLLVGCVGRLHASKGIDLLVKAFRTAAPRHAALALVGEGPLEAELRRLAQGDARIHFLGGRGDIRNLLPAMDLFVSPSREESFGLAILEAMHAGLPIIATQAPGPMEVLAGQPAELVPLNDLPALSQSMQRRLGQLHGMPRQSVVYDLQRFDRDQSVARVMDFYDELLQAPLPARGGRTPAAAPAHA